MVAILSEYFPLQAGWPQLTPQDSGTWVRAVREGDRGRVEYVI